MKAEGIDCRTSPYQVTKLKEGVQVAGRRAEHERCTQSELLTLLTQSALLTLLTQSALLTSLTQSELLTSLTQFTAGQLILQLPQLWREPSGHVGALSCCAKVRYRQVCIMTGLAQTAKG